MKNLVIILTLEITKYKSINRNIKLIKYILIIFFITTLI